MTQAALAEAAGVTDETVSRIERGAYEPALSTVVAVAEALGLSLDELAGAGSDEPARRPRSRPDSPVAARITERIGLLDPATLRAVLRLVEAIGVAEKSAPYSRAPGRRSRR